MARIVKHTRQEPFEIAVGGETQYICACGLSANLPYCDGSHAHTAGEDAAALYWYDGDLERHDATGALESLAAEA